MSWGSISQIQLSIHFPLVQSAHQNVLHTSVNEGMFKRKKERKKRDKGIMYIFTHKQNVLKRETNV